MSEPNDYTHSLRLVKALLIVTSLQKKEDHRAQRSLKEFRQELDWAPMAELMIDGEVWHYAVDVRGYDPKFVFAHPDVLLAYPETSVYYRGMCGLSLKAARDYFGTVERLEKGGRGTRFKRPKAEKMARTYNTFICSIIRNSTDWTLENGRRTIIATLGITLDGIMLNKVGDIAEQLIRTLLMEWLIDHKLLIQPDLTKEHVQDALPPVCQLAHDITMEHAPEPDVSFWRELPSGGRELLAVVEIKGGIDPAGALERYGAATKSFRHAQELNSRCRNFLLCAVFTKELDRRIRDDRLVDRHFDIIRILDDPEERDRFLSELFHFTLRLF